MMTVPAEFESIEEIVKNYNKVIEVKLEQNTQQKAKIDKYKCWLYCCKRCKGKVRAEQDIIPSEDIKKSKTMKEIKDDELKRSFHTSDLLSERVDHEIEYFAVNLPHTLSIIDRRHFMYLLSLVSQRDLAYLEIPILQTIITFKWLTYTRGYFMRQFIKALIFAVSFILDISLVNCNDPIYSYEVEPDSYLGAAIALRVICGAYILDLAQGEAR